MKSTRTGILVPILVLALAALACGLPDVTSLLDPMPKDDFSNSASGWGTGTDAQSSVEYADGGLKIVVFQPLYVTWSTPDTTVYENTHMEVSVRNASTDPEAMFGFICNEQGTTNSFYYAGVSPDGYYAFIKAVTGQDDVYMKDGFSDLISADPASMRLGMDCRSDGMTLYVNGQLIDSVSDSTYTSGVIGLFAATDDQASGADVVFDDFSSSKLDP